MSFILKSYNLLALESCMCVLLFICCVLSFFRSIPLLSRASASSYNGSPHDADGAHHDVSYSRPAAGDKEGDEAAPPKSSGTVAERVLYHVIMMLVRTAALCCCAESLFLFFFCRELMV